MNINLDEKKIIRITYAVDESKIIDFVCKDGELISANTLNITRIKEKVNGNVLSDREMIEKIKKAKVLENYKNEKECEKDANDLELFKKKDLSKNIEKAKNIIELDKDGTLDEIVKENHDYLKKKKLEDYAFEKAYKD